MMQILGNKDDSTIIRIAAYAALVIPFFIMIIKLVGTTVTGSLSMQAALIDSISDLISSVFVIASVHISQRQETSDYQFGFGKVQPLGALVQAVFIFASGIFFIIEAYQSFLYGEEIKHTGFAVILILVSLMLLLVLTRLQKYVINKTDSLIIKSSFLHFHMDVFIDFAVLVSVLFGHYFNVFFIDSIFGIAFTSYILFSAWKLLKSALSQLIDKSFSKKDMQKISDILQKYKDIAKVENILTREAGERKFVTLEISMNKDTALEDVYKITQSVKSDISKMFKDILTHIEVKTINTRIMD